MPVSTLSPLSSQMLKRIPLTPDASSRPKPSIVPRASWPGWSGNSS